MASCPFSLYNSRVTGVPKENLEHFKKRVESLEKKTSTAPVLKWTGIAILIFALLSFMQSAFNPVIPVWMTWAFAVLGMILVVVGSVVIAGKFLSDHSEGVEEQERKFNIRERSGRARCVYLEGRVPDGKGIVGRCKLYEFDMIEYPYCLYCDEYRAMGGSPDV